MLSLAFTFFIFFQVIMIWLLANEKKNHTVCPSRSWRYIRQSLDARGNRANYSTIRLFVSGGKSQNWRLIPEIWQYRPAKRAQSSTRYRKRLKPHRRPPELLCARLRQRLEELSRWVCKLSSERSVWIKFDACQNLGFITHPLTHISIWAICFIFLSPICP